MRAFRANDRLARPQVLTCLVVLAVASVLVSLPGSRPIDPRPPGGSLAEFFGWTEGRASLEEAITAVCMRRHGYQFILSEVDRSARPGFGLDPDDYASRYGYGVTKAPQTSIPTAEGPDPNFMYFSSLSTADQQAYLRVLQVSNGAPRSQTGSCSGDAEFFINRDHQLLASEFGDKLNELDDTVTHRLRAEGRFADWSLCMRAKGLGSPTSPGVFVAETSASLGTELAGAEGEAEEVERIRVREIDIAVRERSCTRTLEGRTNVLRRHLETDFVLENMAELEGIRAQYRNEIDEYLDKPS